MKKIFVFMFLLILMACDQDFAFFKPSSSLKHYQKIENGKEIFSKYNNKEIEVIGVFNMDSENLYLNIGESKVWLEFNFFDKLKDINGNILDGVKLKSYNNKKVKIKGRFKLGKGGHLGAYDSRIIDIAFFGSSDY